MRGPHNILLNIFGSRSLFEFDMPDVRLQYRFIRFPYVRSIRQRGQCTVDLYLIDFRSCRMPTLPRFLENIRAVLYQAPPLPRARSI